MKNAILFVLLIIVASGCSTQQAVEKEDTMNIHEKINYVEFPAKDMAATKKFFAQVFNWSFTDYGPEYMDVKDVGLDVGFYKSDLTARYVDGSALIVFYSKELEATQDKIEKAGGHITRPIISFPGGRRFQFADPSGNEYGVWSDL
jgi:predicted enzyme related to lactoylglutathione lyase